MTILNVLILIVCVLLVLIVLVQNSKGGGLASNFSAPNQMMGVRRTNDFLEKGTWILAGFLAVFCLAFALLTKGSKTEQKMSTEIESGAKKQQTAPAASPAAPTAPAPTTQPLPTAPIK